MRVCRWRNAATACLIALLAGSGSRAQDAGARVEISLAPGRVAPASPLPVRLRAVRSGESRLLDASAPGETQVDLPAEGPPWRLLAEAPGYWSPEVLLQPRSPVKLTLWQTGRLGGRIVAPPDAGKLEEIEVRFQSAPGPSRPEIPRSTRRCPVREGRWECELPAGLLDLRVQAEGFVPRYLWGVEVSRERLRDAGRLDLVRGGSVVGWVVVEGRPELAGAKPLIELQPRMLLNPGSRAAAERIRTTALTAQPTERGFFQVTGVPPGELAVTARLEGFVAARGSATVFADRETELPEPITLHRPLAFEVRLQPPLDPYGHPWRIELLEPVSLQSYRPAAMGQAEASGVWSKEGLDPGPYLLFVKDFAGSYWSRERIEVSPERTALDLEIGLVGVAGRITLGDEPLSATLWFQNPKGGERIRADSDERGRFEGYLTREGEWSVDLEWPDGSVQALEPVEVTLPPGSRTARLDLRVANTRLTVRVRREKGGAAPGAEVILLSSPERRRREAQAVSDGEGEVVFRGLSPGVLHLYAESADSTSDWVVHRLSEGEEGETVELVLREKVRLSGKVAAAQGPVAGALITLFPASAEGSRAWQVKGVSEADGRFQVLVDRSAKFASLAVFAPGFAARILPAPSNWSPEREITIPVSQEGGDLLVHTESLGDWVARRSHLIHAGAALPLLNFIHDGRAVPREGGWHALPAMEPGSYTLCPEWQSPPGDCATGHLNAGGELSLSARERPGADGPGKESPR